MIFLSTILRALGIFITTRFIEMRRHHISLGLFAGYLKNNYQFFIDTNSAELTKIILSEVDRIVAQLIRPIINMISYVFLLVFVLLFLLFINPIITLLITVVFGFFYAIIYLSLRAKIKELGDQTVTANKGRFAITGEAFANIKYLKFSGLETFYASRFEKTRTGFHAQWQCSLY